MDESELAEKARHAWPEALRKCDYEAVETLLKENEALIHEMVDNMLPVMLAVRAKNSKIVRLLLEHGARASGLRSYQEGNRYDSLYLAAQEGDAETCEVLLEVGKLDPNGTPSLRPVLVAAHHHHLNVLLVLDKHGADLHVVHARDGANAIIETSRYTSSLAIIEFLVSRGVACDLEDSTGRTPLMHLANLGDVESIKVLVEKGGAKLDHRAKRHVRDHQAAQTEDVLSLAEKRKMSEVVFYCWTQGLNPSNVSMRCHLGDINVTKPRANADIGARNHFALAASDSRIFVFGGVASPFDPKIPTIQAEPLSTSDDALPAVFRSALALRQRSKASTAKNVDAKHKEGENLTDNEEDGNDGDEEEILPDPVEAGVMQQVNRQDDAVQLLQILGNNPGEAEIQRLMILAREDPAIAGLLERLMAGADEEMLDDDDTDTEDDSDGADDIPRYEPNVADDGSLSDHLDDLEKQLDHYEEARLNQTAPPPPSDDADDDGNADVASVASDADSDSSTESHIDTAEYRYVGDESSQTSFDCFCLDLNETTMEPIFPNPKMNPKLIHNKLNPNKHGKYMAIDKDGLGGRAVTPADNETFPPCLALGVKSFNKQRGSFGYYEMHVISAGSRRLLALGFVGRNAPLEGRQPGWDQGTFGLHGDDGSMFCQEGAGTQFADRFEAGDVVGAGIDWESGRVFFTVNGCFLGFTPVKARLTRLYPCIAVRNPDAQFRVNFGAEPFRFDFRAPVLNWKRILPPTGKINALSPLAESWHETSEREEEKADAAPTSFYRNVPRLTRPIFATEPSNKYLVLLTIDPNPTALNDVFLFHLEKLAFIRHTSPPGAPSMPSRLWSPQTQTCQITPRTMLFYRPRAKSFPPVIAFFDTVLLRWFDVSQSQPSLESNSMDLSASAGLKQSATYNLQASGAIDPLDEKMPQEIPEYHAMWLEVLTTMDQANAETAKLHLAGTNVVWASPDSYVLVDPVTGMHSAQPYNAQSSSVPAVAMATESSTVSIGDSAVVFGGWDGEEQRNDIAVFNSSTGTWYTPPYTGTIPRTRNSHGGVVAYTKSAYFGVNASDLPSGKLWLDEAQPVFINAYGWGGNRLVREVDVFSFSTHKSESAFDTSFPSDIELHLSSEDATEMSNFETAPAHRILLYCRSSKFRRILSGEENNTSKYELISPSASSAADQQSSSAIFKVRVESIEAFKGMLHFLYTDEIVREAGWLGRNSRALARLVDAWAPELSPKLLERLLLSRSTLPNLFGTQMLAGFTNDKFADLVLDVNDPSTGEQCSIPVHKLVLVSRSPYFRALCLGGMAESGQKMIRVESPIAAFKLVLEFLYSYEVPYDRISEYIIDMFVLACRFQVSKLKATIENLLIFNLAPENVCAILFVAQEQSSTDLYNQCLKFVKDNLDEVQADEGWIDFKASVEPLLATS